MKTSVAASLALIAVVVACPSASQTPAAKTQQHGRLFPPTDLGLLEMPDRDLWQLPEQIMDVLGSAEASVVADVGAGSGWFTVRLARRVGPNGVVFAQDVQPEMLNAISRRAQSQPRWLPMARAGRLKEDALVGPDGTRLARRPGHIAYWFAWQAFIQGAPLARADKS